MVDDDYWFQQRYEAAMLREHEKGHPESDAAQGKDAMTENKPVTASPGVTLIRAERLRQVAAEGYTPEHDAGHPDGELARAGATYALWAAGTLRTTVNPYDAMRWWPPDWKFGYRDDPVRALVKAGALIAAEIDRLTAKASHGWPPTPGKCMFCVRQDEEHQDG